MSFLRVFYDNAPGTIVLSTHDSISIQKILGEAGIRFEQWETIPSVNVSDSAESVMQAYKNRIDTLIAEEGYQSVDVISLDYRQDHLKGNVNDLRHKFLSEHSHLEDEVRFFVAGCGLFSLHLENKVYEVLCEQGDLISVPANTPHWFDMGPRPSFIAIRFFSNKDGWIAHYSGDQIADQFSRLDP